ncbi:unnamed protein product [Lampetra fluviatilis]
MDKDKRDIGSHAAKNMQELFVNFALILICLLLMYIIVKLMDGKPVDEIGDGMTAQGGDAPDGTNVAETE